MYTDPGDDGSYSDNESYDELSFVAIELNDYSSSELSNDSDYQKDYKNAFSHKGSQDVKQEDDSLSYMMLPPEDLVYLSDDSCKPPPKRVRFEHLFVQQQ